MIYLEKLLYTQDKTCHQKLLKSLLQQDLFTTPSLQILWKSTMNVFNLLSANPTKWFEWYADELFECVWPFCEIGA